MTPMMDGIASARVVDEGVIVEKGDDAEVVASVDEVEGTSVEEEVCRG